MRALSLLTLVVLAVLVYGSEVYVFKVWLPQPYSGFGIYVPGAVWELGEAAWLFMAPVERGEAVHALTGNITEAKLYDARAVYIAIPAVPPADVAEADAWLETPVGKYPIRIGKPQGLTLTLVDSEEEVYKVLREAGHSPKYMGEATLVEAEGRLPEPHGPVPLAPSVGSTYRVYGGVYFVPATVSVDTTTIKPRARRGLQVCSNVSDAAFVGYDAEAMTLGVYILGGSAAGKLVVEVYAMEDTRVPAPCSFLGRWEAGLVNKTYYTVRYVNASVSSAKPLAVRVYVRAGSVSGSPRVFVNASVTYSRTYRYGFEMSEYATYVGGGRPTAINRRVSMVVFGPYSIPDGVASGRHEVKFAVTAEPVSGTCPPITADWLINGVWAAGGVFHGSSTSAGCRYAIAFSQERLEAAGLWFAKPFAGAYYYVVKLRYPDGRTPYIKTVEVLGHEALRGWRWAEVWRATPSDAPPFIWMMSFTASEVQVLYVAHPPQSSTSPPALVHGVLSFRNTVPSMDFFQVAVSGGLYVGGRREPVKSLSLTMEFSTSVRGALVSAEYVAPTWIERIWEPVWVYYAKVVMAIVNFFASLFGLGSGQYHGLSFAVDKAIRSAVNAPTASNPDEYTLKITWVKGWADSHYADEIHIYVIQQPKNMLTTTPTTVTVKELKLEYATYTPNLRWHIHPTSDIAYTLTAPPQPFLKIWMHGGLTSSGEIYRPGWG